VVHEVDAVAHLDLVVAEADVRVGCVDPHHHRATHRRVATSAREEAEDRDDDAGEFPVEHVRAPCVRDACTHSAGASHVNVSARVTVLIKQGVARCSLRDNDFAVVTLNPPPLLERARHRLAVRMWAGFGALFAVLAFAVVICVGAMLTAYHALESISEIAAAERHAVAIGVAAREQYMHQTHGVLLREPQHLGHEHHWGAMLATHVQSLRPMVGEDEQRKLDTISGESSAMSDAFAKEILPAVIAGDEQRLRTAHAMVEKRLDAMISAADASVADLSARTKEASGFATRNVRTSSGIAVLTTLVAALIALQLAQALARQIVQPVAALDRAAARIGRGEFDANVPRIGTVEFDRLADGLRQMARQLSERETRLIKAERLAAVGALAAGVAHELNNPLGVIVGYVKLLREKHLENGAGVELSIIDDEAQQCRRIIDDLVALAREPRIERVEADVAALVRDTCSRLEAVPEVEGREVRVDAGTEIRLDVDPTRIAQVVRNLVMNAVAASGPHAAVEVVVRPSEEGGATIVVRDHGSGISPEDLPHVFEPFYSRRSGGTGLGLAVSQRIVRTHGGTIEIESGGQGTTVCVRLPAGEVQQ